MLKEINAGSLSGSRRAPGGGHGNPVFLPGESMDRGAW